jgi:hypothetical protein
MARRKIPLAELRPVDLFTGRTAIKEAEVLLLDEEDRDERPSAARDYDSVKGQMAETAIRWLGMDVFEDGDDVLLAIGPKGDGVLMAVTAGRGICPGRQTHVRLSRKQLLKLKKLADQI